MSGVPDLVGKSSRSNITSPSRSLRASVMGSILLALVISLVAGGVVTVLRARHSVLVELQTALEGARETARDAIETSPGQGRVVALFRTDRHVEAVLFDATGAVAAT